MNIFQAIKSAVGPKRQRVYLAWVKEPWGWVSYEIEAESHSEAERKAYQRFVGTQGFWTVEVDQEPLP